MLVPFGAPLSPPNGSSASASTSSEVDGLPLRNWL